MYGIASWVIGRYMPRVRLIHQTICQGNHTSHNLNDQEIIIDNIQSFRRIGQSDEDSNSMAGHEEGRNCNRLKEEEKY